jgi:GT2 family glycosyltransferase
LRAAVAHRFPFGQPHLRHGGDADLAERLRAAGHKLLYEPGMEMTHNYAANAGELWSHCVSRGGAEHRSLAARGIPAAGAVREAVGRWRYLSRRLRREGTSAGLSPARRPVSLAFAAAYCAAMSLGRRHAQRGGEERREPF